MFFFRYVKFLVKSHKNIGFWQERAVAVLDLIYNTEHKLECALSILRVPSIESIKINSIKSIEFNFRLHQFRGHRLSQLSCD